MPYKDPEKRRECAREAARRLRDKDPEASREAGREKTRRWRAENPEKAREMQRRWRAVHPEKAREMQRRRRAHLVAEVHGLLGGKCLVCGSEERLEIDHALGDGCERRAETSPSSELYRIHDALREDPWDGRFILLCKTCHQEKTNEQVRATA